MTTRTGSSGARAEIRAWVLSNGRNLSDTTLTDQTKLLEGRHITSLQVPELLMTIERVRRAPIDLSALKAGDMKDLDTIYARFLGEGAIP